MLPDTAAFFRGDTINTNPKKYALSCARLLAFIMIISAHIIEKLFYGQDGPASTLCSVLTCGVELFMLISGYLYGSRVDLFKSKSVIRFLFDRFKRILLDYYIYFFLVIIPVFILFDPNNINITSAFKMFICHTPLTGVHHLWFISYILFCYLITPLLVYYKNHFISSNSFMSVFIGMALLLVANELILRYLLLYFTPGVIDAYIIGFFLPGLFSNKQLRIAISIPLFVLSSILCINNLFDSTYMRIFASLSLFSTVLFLYNCYPIKNRNIIHILDLSDKLSYDLYICHMIYLQTIPLLWLTNSILLNILLVLFSTIISAVILNMISNTISKTKVLQIT